MSTALQIARSKMEEVMFNFSLALEVMPHLTANQRAAITKAAGALAKECMTIQTDMDVQLIREAFRD